MQRTRQGRAMRAVAHSHEIASLLGIPVAWVIVRLRVRALEAGAAPAGAASMPEPAHVRFLQSGWGFDWIYDRVLVKPFMLLAKVNAHDVVDRFFDGVGGLNMLLSRGLRWTQNGRVRWYAAGAAAGAVLILAAVVLL